MVRLWHIDTIWRAELAQLTEAATLDLRPDAPGGPVLVLRDPALAATATATLDGSALTASDFTVSYATGISGLTALPWPDGATALDSATLARLMDRTDVDQASSTLYFGRTGLARDAAEALSAPLGGTTLVFVADHQSGTLASFSRAQNGALTQLHSVTEANVTTMTSITIDGTLFLIGASVTGHSLTVWRVDADGAPMPWVQMNFCRLPPRKGSWRLAPNTAR